MRRSPTARKVRVGARILTLLRKAVSRFDMSCRFPAQGVAQESHDERLLPVATEAYDGDTRSLELHWYELEREPDDPDVMWAIAAVGADSGRDEFARIRRNRISKVRDAVK